MFSIKVNLEVRALYGKPHTFFFIDFNFKANYE